MGAQQNKGRLSKAKEEVLSRQLFSIKRLEYKGVS